VPETGEHPARPLWKTMLYLFAAWNAAIFAFVNVPLAVLGWKTDPAFVLRVGLVLQATSLLVPPIVLLLHGWDRAKSRLGIGAMAAAAIVAALSAGVIAVARHQRAKIQEALDAADRLAPSLQEAMQPPGPGVDSTGAGRENIYIPVDLDDCLAQLRKILKPEDVAKMKAGTEANMSRHHFGLGLWMRNNWRLWAGSRLAKWFNVHGIWHPDDMSGIILNSFWRQLNDRPIELDGQVKRYQEFWKKQETGPPAPADDGAAEGPKKTRGEEQPK
jgi:branched-subunit amino acid transport protein AzlD